MDSTRKAAARTVLVGVPSGDMVHADFCFSFAQALAYTLSAGNRVYICNPKSSLVQIARCEIAAQAKAMGADYTVYLDSDMTFPADTILRLLGHDKDVVCCNAVRKRPPHTSVLDLPKDAYGLVMLETGASTGIMCVKTSVFAHFEPPFQVIWQQEKNAFLGEDYYFAMKCMERGIPVYCDADLSKDIGHIGLGVYRLPKEVDKTRQV